MLHVSSGLKNLKLISAENRMTSDFRLSKKKRCVDGRGEGEGVFSFSCMFKCGQFRG